MKPCKHITYTGSSLELAEATLLETSNTQAIFQMIVHDIRRVQKERLYYDTFDMIGAIGGSLGLFLGFSFFDGICKCMDKITHLIKYLSGRELEVIEPGLGIRKVLNFWVCERMSWEESNNIVYIFGYTRSSHNAIFGTGKKLH